MKYYGLFLILFFTTILGFANPPPAEEVFQITATPSDPNTLLLNWDIRPGFFLYKNRILLTPQANSNIHLGPIRFPESLKKTDKQGQTYEVYRKQLTLPVSILSDQAGESLLNVRYQGCANDGFCYPPQLKQIKLTVNQDLALTQATIEQDDTTPTTNNTENEDNDIEQVLSTDNLVWIILGFLGFGLLLSFTPCVLPMVPVLSGIIVGHGESLSTRKAFFLSLSYVLSMSATYAVVGGIVALMGNNLQIVMQSPWVISVFSLIFILLALSMFNFYELRLPLSWQNKLASVTRSHEGGHYLSAALMGSLSTLILSPCVTAPLIGALGYIAQTGNIIFGGIALFSLGFGMGIPLLLIGTSAGKLLPKAGHWMNTVKAFFGVLLIAVAIYLLDRVLPATLIMALWGSLLIFSGIFLGALTRSATHVEKFCQSLGILFLVYGILILIGASQGNTNPLQPLVARPTLQTHLSNQAYRESINTVEQLKEALAKARGKPVVLDFYADWCTACKIIEATTLQDPQVQTALRNFIVLKIDLTANNADSKALQRLYDVVAPPTFLFFNTQGKELNNLRTVGEISSDTFYNKLTRALSLAS
ncbi:protein-disulfide reductase DsbD [Legionella nagasakiensis]|uniref:protein-disulfide reductase DsbD n=1 Tax=Legionella nagasakiensis TaxID=535290 RepID=UPI0010561723|nr:protein-disulfide reductase DsbD [Legionella nagasakiensis]